MTQLQALSQQLKNDFTTNFNMKKNQMTETYIQ